MLQDRHHDSLVTQVERKPSNRCSQFAKHNDRIESLLNMISSSYKFLVKELISSIIILI